MPLKLPAILGRDLAGEVVAAGRGVTGFPKGMRVMALAFGTYAELAIAKAQVLAPIPRCAELRASGCVCPWWSPPAAN